MQAERWQIEESKPADPHNGYLLRVVPMGEYDAEAMEAPEVGEVLVRERGSLSLADVRARLKEQESEYRREADGAREAGEFEGEQNLRSAADVVQCVSNLAFGEAPDGD